MARRPYDYEEDEPGIDQAEDRRDDPPDDYAWFEDSPRNPNVPRR